MVVSGGAFLLPCWLPSQDDEEVQLVSKAPSDWPCRRSDSDSDLQQLRFGQGQLQIKNSFSLLFSEGTEDTSGTLYGARRAWHTQCRAQMLLDQACV